MSKFVGIKTYERFRSLWENNNIDEFSLNFILDTGQIYTHGVFINSAVFGTAANGAVLLSIAGTTNTLALSSHTHSNYYDKNENLDITNHKIISGDNDLLFCSGGALYIGNINNPTYISGSTIQSIKGLNTYTILDTENFSISNTLPTGYTHNNTAYIEYGGNSFLIDYVKRVNTSLSFDYLNSYTLAGTNLLNGDYYGYINFTVDNVYNNPAWAQLRINITGRSIQYRTSADANNWINLGIPNIPLNALNIAGIVSAPNSNTQNKVWKTDEDGNPGWRDEKSYTFYNLEFQQISGTSLTTYNTQALKTILAGSNISFSYENNIITINALDTTYNVFIGASANDDGSSGLVPKPIIGNQNCFLKGDGTWSTPIDTWKEANTAQEGYIPRLVTGGSTISSQASEYVLTYVSTGTGVITPSWKLLPTEAFSDTWNVASITQAGYVPQAVKGKFLHSNDTTGDLEWIDDNDTKYSVFTGATITDNGTTGLVTAPNAGDQDKFLRGDGTWDTPLNTWIAWKGATETSNGVAGYMPAPTSALRNLFLRGDGTWVSLNNYMLPTATNLVLGGIKVGTTLDDVTGYTKVHIKDGFAYYHDTTYSFSKLKFLLTSGTDLMTYDSLATRTIVAGNNITFTHSNNVLTIKATDTTYNTASSSTLGLVKTGAAVTDITGMTAVHIKDGVIYYKDTNTIYSTVSKTAAGLCPILPNETTTTKYLRLDGTWVTPPNDNTWKAANASQEGYVPKSTANKILRANADGALYWGDDANTTYTFYNLLFQNSSGTTVDTYKPTTSPTKTLKAGSNVTISAASNVITIASTDTNTWRGIQDNLTSSSNTTESLSAKQGYLLANGSARDSTKIPLFRYGTTGTTTKIKININSTTLWMLCFIVTLYQSYRATKIMISGYQYGSNYWYLPEAHILGDSDGTETISVYFGYDAVNKLWVGFDGGNYTGVSINDVTNGFYQISDFSDLFTISNVSSLATLQKTVTAASKANYANSAGSANSVAWDNVSGKPSTYAPSSHTHDYLPLSGGTLSGKLTFNQGSSVRDRGIIGSYDPDRAAAIWAMGSSYQIKADGTTFGSLYGAAYAYFGSGHTFGAGYSNGHSLVWCLKGSIYAALGNSIWSRGGFIKNGSSDSYILLGGGGHKAVSDFATSGHNHNSSYVSSLTTSGNYLRWVKNGSNNDITIPYATNADTVDGYHETAFFRIRSRVLENSNANNISLLGGFLNATGNGSGNSNYPETYSDFFDFPIHYHTQFSCRSNFYWRTLSSNPAGNGVWRTLLDSYNSSVSLSGSTLTVKINGTEKSLTNTWRGIQDNLTSSTKTTESLSAKQGYLLANGSARDSTKLPLAGGTMTGHITMGGLAIYFGKAGNNAIMSYSSSYPNYGIWYNDTSVDTMTFSASNNANDATKADFAINGGGDGVLTSRGNKIWHAGNDGSGSGLDADLLDGNHASAFATSGHTHAYSQITDGTSSSTNSGWSRVLSNTYGNSQKSIFYMCHGGGYGAHLRGYSTSSSVYMLLIYNSSKEVFGVYGDGHSVFGGNVNAPNYYTTSDRLKKQNISLFSEHIRKFQLKDTKTWHYGVIALEVPEMFRLGEKGNMTVNYNSVLSYYVGLLENRVKELELEVLKLKKNNYDNTK